jgi:hypothetical protein
LKNFMNSKSLLIAIAALALTASGAQAFSSNALITAGLSEEQQAAFEVARELRHEGDVTAARDVLVEAGIDADTLEKVRTAIHAERHAGHKAMKAALAANDFAAFTTAIKDSPLADVITTEEDFKSFKEAHELMKSGDRDGARVIFDELGVPQPKEGKGHRGHGMHGQPKFLSQLTDAQKDAFAVARQANDKDAMEAILDEAGIVKPTKGDVPHRLRDGRELH